MTNPTAPPKHLSAGSEKLWRSVLADHELERRHEAALQTALEALDRMRRVQAQLDADGVTTVDRCGGVKAHPLMVVERDSRADEDEVRQGIVWADYRHRLSPYLFPHPDDIPAMAAMNIRLARAHEIPMDEFAAGSPGTEPTWPHYRGHR